MKAWLAKHPRFHCHFMPISAPWLNLVERFFAGITRKRIRRGIFKSVAEIEVVIDHTLAQRNGAPKPFVWTKSAAAAIKKKRRALDKLEACNTRYQALDSEH